MDVTKNSKSNTNKISTLSIDPRRHNVNGKGEQKNKIKEKKFLWKVILPCESRQN